ncbi:MupG family TIM beta-alpha barrel fold protein [Metabacillus sp. JX24]|uniref:MupG family TIM beta-alpha barrel fold protein n=1 Tax=Metabacillus sp. JX24 TaxID=3240759 RepID=UPI00351009D2
MIGISFYLQDPHAEQQILHAAASGVKRAFTSLHIPEEKGNLKQRAKELLELAEKHDIEIHADVSPSTLKHLDIHKFEELSAFGVRGIRLDDGFDEAAIKSLSSVFSLSINASTVTESELSALLENGLEPQKIIAWHNFYPRRETGLDEEFFHSQNELFKKYGIETAAFIPGAGTKRGPLYDGLPTLEKHRNISSYAAGVELLLKVNHVYVGDPGTEDSLIEKLSLYKKQNILSLRILSDQFTGGFYQFRPDASRDVFRLKDTRLAEEVKPCNTIERQIGMITMDNSGYGRYRGEVQICRRVLAADERVNVIGRVIDEDLPLLNLALPGQKVKIDAV